MGLLSNIGSAFTKAMNTLTVGFVHPVQTIQAVISKEKTIDKVIEQHFEQPLSTQIGQTFLATAGYATAVIGGGAVATAAKAGTLKAAVVQGAKSLIPTTTKGKVLTAVAAPVVVGAIAKQPAAAVKFIAKAPGELSQFGGDVATFATNPSLESAKQIIKESPVISAGVGLLLVGGAAKAIIPAIATTRQTEAIQEQTEAIKGAGTPVILPTTSSDKIKEIPVTAAPVPQVAETKKISSGNGVKRRRKAKVKEKPMNISQRVSVLVSNNNSTKKYLNRIVLAH